jgi:hypothetical protein
MPNILSKVGAIFGGAAAGASPIGQAATVVDGVKGIIGMFKLSPEVKAELEAQLTMQNLDLEKAALVGQLEINKQEAASPNWFIAGWRPAVGWVCALALVWAYILQPFITYFLLVFHVTLPANLPSLDTGTLVTGLLLPLLGVATLRTVEKVTGTEKNR